MSLNNNGRNLEMSNNPREIKHVDEHGLGSVITVDGEDLLYTAKTLKESGYNLFIFMTGIDYPETLKLTYRIISVGNTSTKTKSVFIQTEVPKDNPVVDSLTSVWPNASWHEREAYDLFGVVFEGHPELKRILLPDDWEGHPLRKDYADDYMVVFPQFQKDKEKQRDKKTVAKKETGKVKGEKDG